MFSSFCFLLLFSIFEDSENKSAGFLLYCYSFYYIYCYYYCCCYCCCAFCYWCYLIGYILSCTLLFVIIYYFYLHFVVFCYYLFLCFIIYCHLFAGKGFQQTFLPGSRLNVVHPSKIRLVVLSIR